MNYPLRELTDQCLRLLKDVKENQFNQDTGSIPVYPTKKYKPCGCFGAWLAAKLDLKGEKIVNEHKRLYSFKQGEAWFYKRAKELANLTPGQVDEIMYSVGCGVYLFDSFSWHIPVKEALKRAGKLTQVEINKTLENFGLL